MPLGGRIRNMLAQTGFEVLDMLVHLLSEPLSVCSKDKNDYALCDMSGNVAELVWDKYSGGIYRLYANDSTVQDPVGPRRGLSHVIRGALSDNLDRMPASLDEFYLLIYSK